MVCILFTGRIFIPFKKWRGSVGLTQVAVLRMAVWFHIGHRSWYFSHYSSSMLWVLKCLRVYYEGCNNAWNIPLNVLKNVIIKYIITPMLMASPLSMLPVYRRRTCYCTSRHMIGATQVRAWLYMLQSCEKGHFLLITFGSSFTFLSTPPYMSKSQRYWKWFWDTCNVP